MSRIHALFLISAIFSLSIFSSQAQNSSDTVVIAGPEYGRSKFSRILWGDHYRDVWTTPIRVEIFDPASIGGGLTATEMGGGKQTQSLQFRGGDGNEYVARSINKDPRKAIPVRLQGTFAEKIVKDQVSSSHPYGSLVVPKLADAVGIIHPDPQVYYVPYLKELGEFADEFQNILVTFEIRPDKDAKVFGNFKDVDKSDKLFEKMQKSSLTQVNQHDLVKNRLFDMLLGDWDRHEDQYRWGEKEEGKMKIFYTIPKDRDQVFTLFDGLIPNIASRKWAVRELEHYDKEYGDVTGLNMSGRSVDRRLLSGLERKDWLAAADLLMTGITDEVINQAVRDLPEEVYPLEGEELSEKLRNRRNKLRDIAEEYYLILAEKVDVIGSDEKEIFLVERLDGGNTRVRGYNAEGEDILFFDRTFIYGETDEIRIYSMGGADSILITGKQKKGMKIRILPGTGDDHVVDQSSVKGLFNKTKVYTHKGSGLKLEKSKETKRIRVASDSVFSYTDTAYQYSYLGPLVSIEYNVDDGLFLGGGVIIKREGFRKSPWGSTHEISANYATQFSSFSAKYLGIFYSKFGKYWDFGLLAEGEGPKYIMNYFGEGNDTRQVEKVNYYRMRQNRALIQPSAIHRVSPKFRYEFGPFAEYNEVQDSPGRIFGEPDFAYKNEVNVPYWFTGGNFQTYLITKNDSLNPTSGISWINQVRPTFEIGGGAQFTNFYSELSFYYKPLGALPFIFAHRLGGSHILGDYRFFQASFLGGTTNLRGFRRERFAGRSSAFINNEIRTKVSNFRTYLVSGEWGLFGFADAGRVWADGDESETIHLGYGPGIWFNFLNVFLLSASYGISAEGGYINLNSGFLF